MTPASGLLLLLSAAPAFAAPSAQDSKPQAPVRCELGAPTPPFAVRLEWTMTTKGKLAVEDQGRRTVVDVDETFNYVLLDEFHGNPSGSPTTKYRRTVLESRRTQRPDVALDDGSAGLVMDFTDANEEAAFELVGCLASKSVRTRLGETAGFVGADLYFPDVMDVGSEHTLVALPLLRTLLPGEGPLTDARGTLRLEAVDVTAERARFAGSASAAQATTVADKAAKAVYRLDLKVEFCLASRLPTSIAADGVMTTEAVDPPRAAFSGEAKIAGRLVVAPVKDVEAAKRAKPTHRDVKRSWGGATFVLPSRWMASAATPTLMSYVDARFPSDRLVNLDVSRLEDEDDVAGEPFLSDYAASLESIGTDVKVARAFIGPGKAASISFVGKERNDSGLGYVLAGPNRSAMVLLLRGPPEGLKAGEADLKKAAASLKYAP